MTNPNPNSAFTHRICWPDDDPRKNAYLLFKTFTEVRRLADRFDVRGHLEFRGALIRPGLRDFNCSPAVFAIILHQEGMAIAGLVAFLSSQPQAVGQRIACATAKTADCVGLNRTNWLMLYPAYSMTRLGNNDLMQTRIKHLNVISIMLDLNPILPLHGKPPGTKACKNR